MKIIDVLNKQANGELENGFEFKHNNIHYVYFKSVDDIQRLDNGTNIGWNISINRHLNDEVEVIEENKELKKLPNEIYIKLQKGRYNLENILNGARTDLKMHQDKINELVQEINKLKKGENHE